MSERPVVRLGRVHRAAGKLAFEPVADAVLDARAGEAVEVAVMYDYVEASTEREHFQVRLSAEADGRTLGNVERKITDTPGMTDVEHAALVVTTWFPTPGIFEGQFTVEAEYGSAPWNDEGAAKVEKLRERGRFVVRVH